MYPLNGALLSKVGVFQASRKRLVLWVDLVFLSVSRGRWRWLWRSWLKRSRKRDQPASAETNPTWTLTWRSLSGSLTLTTHACTFIHTNAHPSVLSGAQRPPSCGSPPPIKHSSSSCGGVSSGLSSFSSSSSLLSSSSVSSSTPSR